MYFQAKIRPFAVVLRALRSIYARTGAAAPLFLSLFSAA